MPTPDVVKAQIQALVRIRQLRAGPESEWLRLGNEAMNEALSVGARLRSVREAAGLAVEPTRAGVIVELNGGRARIQLDDGEYRWMPVLGQTRVGERLLVSEDGLYPGDG